MSSAKQKKFDIITIGDSTIDTFIKIHDATVECDINDRDCKICIKYGEKIPVDSISHHVAGNAVNVALACKKLGLKVGIYTNVGDDEHGNLIKKTLAKANISPDYIEVHAGYESNLSVVLTFRGERTIFVYHQPWQYHLPKLSASSWIYLTSLSGTFKNSRIVNEIISYIDKSGAKLVFSPGTYQIKVGVDKYPKLIERCEILTLNLEEAKTILGIDHSEVADIKDILSKLLLLGPKIVVVTDGDKGSYASDGKRNLKTGVFPVKVVEKTGAGDAYSAGFICGIFYDKPIEEAMIWGTLNAAHVVSDLSTSKGHLTRESLENHRRVAKSLVAVSF